MRRAGGGVALEAKQCSIGAERNVGIRHTEISDYSRNRGVRIDRNKAPDHSVAVIRRLRCDPVKHVIERIEIQSSHSDPSAARRIRYRCDQYGSGGAGIDSVEVARDSVRSSRGIHDGQTFSGRAGVDDRLDFGLR